MDYEELLQNRDTLRKNRNKSRRRIRKALILFVVLLAVGLSAALILHSRGNEESRAGEGDVETTEEETVEETGEVHTVPGENPTQPETAASYEAEEEGERDGWTVAFGKLNVREQPNSTSEVVGHFTYNTKVVVSGKKTAGFYQVTGPDSRTGEEISGYAAADYISATEPEDPYIFLDVPVYRQYDIRWSGVRLGRSRYTIGSAGCTTTCIAMLRSYMTGKVLRPDEVSKTLWYSGEGNLGWPDDLDTKSTTNYMEFIFQQLSKGRPVMVGAKTRSGAQHWVLVVGYVGNAKEFRPADFVINDPGKGKRANLKQFIDDFPRLYKIAYYVK